MPMKSIKSFRAINLEITRILFTDAKIIVRVMKQLQHCKKMLVNGY